MCAARPRSVQVLQLDGPSFRVRHKKMVDPLDSADGSHIGFEHTRRPGAKLYEPFLLRLGQTFPDGKPTGFMHVSGVGSPCRERLDDRQLLQERPLTADSARSESSINSARMPASHQCGTAAASSAKRKAVRSPSGNVGKGQIDRGKGEKSGITMCISDQLELLMAIQRRASHPYIRTWDPEDWQARSPFPRRAGELASRTQGLVVRRDLPGHTQASPRDLAPAE